MFPEAALQSALLDYFAVMSAAVTAVDPVQLEAFNLVTASAQQPVTEADVLQRIAALQLSDLVELKQNTDRSTLGLTMYEGSIMNSPIIHAILRMDSKKERRSAFGAFSSLLMTVTVLMTQGSITSLLYVVMNNTLLKYYSTIELWDKKGVPELCTDYLRTVNAQMHEVIG
jgi:hypothetical protein